MKILVDADACPVKHIIIKIATQYNIHVVMFADTSHILNADCCEVITVDTFKDSVDIALINKACKGDVIVTQDYGLAALALAKGVFAISQNGLVYSNYNIDKLLFERHISQKARNSGMKTKGPCKRTNENDEMFRNNFTKLISEINMSAVIVI